MNPVRICLVGAGRAGAVHAENLVEYTPRGALVSVVDPAPDSARALSGRLGDPPAFEDLDQALDRVEADAIVIATPTFTHRALAITAFERGLHVFCEKPMALTGKECDEMIAAAERAEAVLQVGFVRRFQPEFVEARARIEQGEIGEPMLVKSLTRGPGLPPRWAQDLALSNGMLAEVNSHDFDSVRWLAGSDVERVYAEVANIKGERLGVTSDQFYDNAVVTLRFRSGAIGAIDGTCPADYGYDGRVEVVGDRGLLTLGEVQGMPLLSCVDREAGARRPVHRTWPERFSWAYVREIRAFVDAVQGGEAPRATGLDGKRAVEAVQAANRSWQEGAPVALSESVA